MQDNVCVKAARGERTARAPCAQWTDYERTLRQGSKETAHPHKKQHVKINVVPAVLLGSRVTRQHLSPKQPDSIDGVAARLPPQHG